MKRWRKKKRMTTGIAASTTPAQNGPHCCAYLSLDEAEETDRERELVGRLQEACSR